MQNFTSHSRCSVLINENYYLLCLESNITLIIEDLLPHICRLELM